jgi:predicted Zn-dependent protease
MGALILLRSWVLLGHWRSQPATQSDWDALRQSLWEHVEELGPEESNELRAELGLAAEAPNLEMVETAVQQEMKAYRPPRAKAELLCEFVGLLSYLLLCPFVFALFGLDFVSLNLPLTWTAFTPLLVSCLAYVVPFFLWKEAGASRTRCLWWSLPFFPLLILALYGVEVRHPYLNPLNPDRQRIAAERVLAMDSIISSGRLAETVKRYGQLLEQAGELEEALLIYQSALRLNASDNELRSDIDRISKQLGGHKLVNESISGRSRQKVFTGAIRAVEIGPELSELDEFTVIIVSMGAVSSRIKMKVAEVMRRELSVDVFIAEGELPLPEHTRRRGLVTGKQWEAKVIAGAFGQAYPALPVAPVKYLLLTPADIYTPESNYLFSGSWPWGALVSFARYEGRGDLLEERTAKQSLSALIKTFPIRPSTSRDCVTSYSRSLDEFDQKGNTPSAAILSEFHVHVNNLDTRWKRYKAVKDR